MFQGGYLSAAVGGPRWSAEAVELGQSRWSDCGPKCCREIQPRSDSGEIEVALESANFDQLNRFRASVQPTRAKFRPSRKVELPRPNSQFELDLRVCVAATPTRENANLAPPETLRLRHEIQAAPYDQLPQSKPTLLGRSPVSDPAPSLDSSVGPIPRPNCCGPPGSGPLSPPPSTLKRTSPELAPQTYTLSCHHELTPPPPMRIPEASLILDPPCQNPRFLLSGGVCVCELQVKAVERLHQPELRCQRWPL